MSVSFLPPLTRQLLEGLWQQRPRGLELAPKTILNAPETILQIGLGNFLRGFVEDFVQLANAAGDFSSRIVSVQRSADRRSGAFVRQDGLYTLVLRGIEDGRLSESKRIIASLSRLLISDGEWETVLSAAANRTIRVIVSNVTEAGLALDPSDTRQGRPPRGFPGKLTQLLWHRWRATGGRDADAAVIPCELIENNGPFVRELVLDQARAWGLDASFPAWVNASVHFASTLVDRIVVGPPPGELLEEEWKALGYRDELLNFAEPFALFVLEADEFIRRHFPIHHASPEVRFVSDLTPYRVRKLRILNGPHTMLAALGRLLGHRNVREAIQDAELGRLVEAAIFHEIIPAMDPPDEAENRRYAGEVLARFRNPAIEHKLLAICLNCSTKAGTRLFPSLRDYLAKRRALPSRVLLGLAGVLLVLEDAEVNDTHAAYVRERWKAVNRCSRDSLLEFARTILAKQVKWSREEIDWKAVAESLADLLLAIGRDGLRPVIALHS